MCSLTIVGGPHDFLLYLNPQPTQLQKQFRLSFGRNRTLRSNLVVKYLKLEPSMASLDPFRHITIGYPKLAARIEVQPELSIYRRFGALNAQNLLYYQAELVDIEEKLRAQQVQDDNDATGEKSLYAKTWFRLKDSAVDGDTKQLDLVTCMRETLKEYSKY
jgi:hypothetical protein